MFRVIDLLRTKYKTFYANQHETPKTLTHTHLKHAPITICCLSINIESVFYSLLFNVFAYVSYYTMLSVCNCFFNSSVQIVFNSFKTLKQE